MDKNSSILKIFLISLSIFIYGCQSLSYVIERNNFSDEIRSMEYGKTRLSKIDNAYPIFIFTHKKNDYIVINRPIGDEYVIFIYRNDTLFSILTSGYARQYWREAFTDNDHTPTVGQFDKLLLSISSNKENTNDLAYRISNFTQSPSAEFSANHDEIVQGPVTILVWLELYTGFAGKTRPEIWASLLALYGIYGDFRTGIVDWKYKKSINKLGKTSENVRLGASSFEWDQLYGLPLSVITISNVEKINIYKLYDDYHISAGIYNGKVVWAGIGYNPNKRTVP